MFAIGYEKDLASSIGQEPAFTEPVVTKPAGAVVKPEAGIADDSELELPPPGA